MKKLLILFTFFCLTKVFFAQSYCDFYLTNTSVYPTSISPGGSINCLGNLNNTGNISTASDSIGYFLSTDLFLDPSDIFLSSRVGYTVNGGGIYDISKSLSIPSNITAGNYYLLFAADYHKKITETNEQNNVNAVLLTITGASNTNTQDYGIFNQTLNNDIISGVSTIVNSTIFSQGNSAISLSIGYYLSNDSIFDLSDTYLSSNGINYVSNYGITNIANYITIPTSFTPGNYYLISYLDYTNAIFESNEKNNYYISPINLVNSTIDLTIKNLTNSTSTFAANTFNTSFNIINNGNIASTTSNLGYYLSNDTIFDANDIFLNSQNFGSISSGGSISNQQLTLTIPNTTAIGNYYVIFLIDYSNLIVESNENNNTKSFSITVVAPTVDLTTLLPTLSTDTIAINNSINTTVKISNLGNTYSSSSNVGYYLSVDSLFDANDIYLNNSNIYQVSAGQSTTTNNYYTIPNTITPGNYYLLFYIDYSNNISETNENNNVTGIPLTIVAPTFDFQIIQVTTPLNCVKGTSFNETYTIKNSGSSISNSVNTEFYISNDTIFDNSDTFLNSTTNYNIGVNSSTNGNIYITIPTTVAIGNYYILTIVDRLNQISETNENNNIKHSPIAIINTTSDLYCSSATVPSTITTNTSFSISCYIQNIGSNTALQSVVGYYLSKNSTYDSTDIFVSSTICNSLNSFNAQTVNSVITLPNTLSSGKYYFIFIADYNHQISESNELNNTYVTPSFNISNSTDIIYTLPTTGSNTSINTCSGILKYDANNNTGALTISPGTIGKYTSLYFNNVSFNYTSNVLLIYDGPSTNSPLIGSYSYSNLPNIVNATNPSGVLTINFSNPYNYYASFSAYISCLDSVSFSDLSIQSNNSISKSTIAAGNSIVSTCNISNISSIQANSSTIGYFLSKDTIWDASDLNLSSEINGVLLPNKSILKTSTITIPSNISNGNYYILQYVDFSNQLYEKDETNNLRWNPLTISSPFIDFTITPTTLLKTTFPANITLTYSNTIFNRGNNLSPSSITGYYLSSDTVKNVGDIYLGYTNVSTISDASSISINANLTIPANTSPGDYYLISFADNNNLINESNESNNTAWNLIHVISSVVDVTISKLSSISSLILAGQSPNIYITNKNIGNTTLSSSSTGCYLSLDTIWNNTDVFLGSLSYGIINPGDSIRSYFSSTIPSNTTTGKYYLIYYADYFNTTIETNENNNIAYTPIQITGLSVDLFIVNNYVVNNLAFKGDALTVNYFIYNKGNSSLQNKNLGIYLSSDSTFSSSDILLNSFLDISTISANSYLQTTHTVSMPSNIGIGDYYILFYTDNTNLISESNELNNIAFTKITLINPNYDLLSINPYSTSYSVDYGKSFTLYSSSYNLGNKSINNNLEYYISTDTIYNSTDVFLATLSNLSFAPQTSNLNTLSLNIPSTISAGNYYILIYSDINNSISELNENNNVTYFKIAITTPSIDLRIVNVSLNTSIISSSTNLICYSVLQNTGNSPVTNCNVGYYLSSNQYLDNTDISIYSQTVNSIGAISTTNLTGYPIITNTILAGNYYLLIKADDLNTINETNENNNISFIQITIINPTSNQSLPDLTITSPSLNYNSVHPGYSIIMNCSINNQGDAISQTSNIGYYLSTNSTYDLSDQLLYNSIGSQLLINESQYISQSLLIPKNIAPGNYYILIVADYLNNETESDETNNAAFHFLTITQSVGLEELTSKSSTFSVYPNPANESIFIEGKNLNFSEINTVDIIDFNGKILTTLLIEKDNGENFIQKIDVSNYSKGIYYLNIHTSETSVKEKITIQ